MEGEGEEAISEEEEEVGKLLKCNSHIYVRLS